MVDIRIEKVYGQYMAVVYNSHNKAIAYIRTEQLEELARETKTMNLVVFGAYA